MPLGGQGLMSGLNEGMDNFLNAYIKMKQLKNQDEEISQKKLANEVDLKYKQQQIEKAQEDKDFSHANTLAGYGQKESEAGRQYDAPPEMEPLLKRYGFKSQYAPSVNNEKSQKTQLLGYQLDEAKKKSIGKTGDAAELRKEYMGNAVTKASMDVASAYKKIQSAAANPSAAGDMSLIYGYMKMQDPGSTVREGEFANAQNAAGVPDQIRNQYNKIMSGQRLNPKQRDDFINQAGNVYKAQMTQQDLLSQNYEDLTKSYGYDPNLVVNRKIFGDGNALLKPKGKEGASTNKISPQDSSALEFIRSNPKDPRSEKIMQVLKKKGLI